MFKALVFSLVSCHTFIQGVLLLREIEIRGRLLTQQYEDTLSRLHSLSSAETKSFQHDTYFCERKYVETNTTKNCPYVLRIRKSEKKSTLAYKSFVDNGSSWIEEETEISDIDSMEKILVYIGQEKYLDIKKHRVSFKYEQMEINLDKIEGLGCFIELEIIHDDIEYGKIKLKNFLIDDLKCKTIEIIDKGYVQLMEEYITSLNTGG